MKRFRICSIVLLIAFTSFVASSCAQRESGEVALATNQGAPFYDWYNDNSLAAQSESVIYYVSSDSATPIIIAADKDTLAEQAKFPMDTVYSITVWGEHLAVSGMLRPEEARRASWVGAAPTEEELGGIAYILLPLDLDANAQIVACSIPALFQSIADEAQYASFHLNYGNLFAHQLFLSENLGDAFESVCRRGILLYSKEPDEMKSLYGNALETFAMRDMQRGEWDLKRYDGLYCAEYIRVYSNSTDTGKILGMSWGADPEFQVIEWLPIEYNTYYMPYSFMFKGKFGFIGSDENGTVLFTYDGRNIPLEAYGESAYGLLRAIPDPDSGTLYLIYCDGRYDSIPGGTDAQLLRLSVNRIDRLNIICFDMNSGKIEKSYELEYSAESVLYVDDDRIVTYRAEDGCIYLYDWEGNGEVKSNPLEFSYGKKAFGIGSITYTWQYAQVCGDYLFIYDVNWPGSQPYKREFYRDATSSTTSAIIDLRGAPPLASG